MRAIYLDCFAGISNSCYLESLSLSKLLSLLLSLEGLSSNAGECDIIILVVY